MKTWKDKRGRELCYNPSHPRASSKGCMFYHIVVAEEKLGRYLREGEVVHHIDGNKGNNSPDNIEVLDSQGKHMIVHARQRAESETGNADLYKCRFCKQWCDPSDPAQDVYIFPNRHAAHHRPCKNEHTQAWREGRRLLELGA